MSIQTTIPDMATLLDLAPEILAGHILAELNSRFTGTSSSRNSFHRGNYANEVEGAYKCGPQQRDAVRHVVHEAWQWLENQGLVAVKPDGDGKWDFITRRGRKVEKPSDLISFQRASYLTKENLHPILSEKVHGLFVTGDFDTAVFQAFKQVEVEVRDASRLSVEDIGVSLMRKAFNVDSGLLTDGSLEKGERQAISDLFAGAIGYQKNAHSHRNVGLSDPGVATELILLANHLLRLVDLARSGKDVVRK